MSANVHAALLVAVMSIVTILLRFLPFLIFRGGKTPAYVSYLGDVLPSAIIGMLVIYCLRSVDLASAPFGLPELISAAVVIGLQSWKRSSLVSIISGTAVYMLLIRVM